MMSGMLYRLSVVHRKLDEEIRREARRRNPDGFRLLRLKKLKLAVKDRLAGHWKRTLVTGTDPTTTGGPGPSDARDVHDVGPP